MAWVNGHGMIEAYGFDPFDEVYVVNNDMMKKIGDHLNKLWMAEDWEALKFSNLELDFGGYKTMALRDKITTRVRSAVNETLRKARG